MDLRAYFKKLREIENSISSKSVLMVSLETQDGGQAGIVTQVPRSTAARHILENRGRLASTQELSAYCGQIKEAREAAEQLATANKMQFVILPAESTPKRTKE